MNGWTGAWLKKRQLERSSGVTLLHLKRTQDFQAKKKPPEGGLFNFTELSDQKTTVATLEQLLVPVSHTSYW